MDCAVCPQMRFATRSPSNEMIFAAPPFAPTRMRPQKGREIAFALDQSPNWSDGGSSSPHGNS
jgi:hypothetical protein